MQLRQEGPQAPENSNADQSPQHMTKNICAKNTAFKIFMRKTVFHHFCNKSTFLQDFFALNFFVDLSKLYLQNFYLKHESYCDQDYKSDMEIKLQNQIL